MVLKQKVWLVLLCHGVEGIRGFARPAPEVAATLEVMVCTDTRFEVLVSAQRSSPLSQTSSLTSSFRRWQHDRRTKTGGGEPHRNDWRRPDLGMALPPTMAAEVVVKLYAIAAGGNEKFGSAISSLHVHVVDGGIS
ncbi:hypothetical protein QYE76_053938 [Lolium multiflorum]|uniref:Secreted protein n=1 Tax=Lolium multiflorum TaxID=4521 RepID=A0AAD8SXC5_LOLMU|nr:hypothetical protein QYE76_053938 [Lolium multiflorum]